MLRKRSWSAASWGKLRSSWPVILIEIGRKDPVGKFFFPDFIPHEVLVGSIPVPTQADEQQADVFRYTT